MVAAELVRMLRTMQAVVNERLGTNAGRMCRCILTPRPYSSPTFLFPWTLAVMSSVLNHPRAFSKAWLARLLGLALLRGGACSSRLCRVVIFLDLLCRRLLLLRTGHGYGNVLISISTLWRAGAAGAARARSHGVANPTSTAAELRGADSDTRQTETAGTLIIPGKLHGGVPTRCESGDTRSG